MFGTNEKFNLQRAFFARDASAFYIFEDYWSHLLRLSNYKPAAIVHVSPFLFNLRLLDGGDELPYTYFCDAGSLRMYSEKGRVEIVFTENEQARFRGRGVTLRIELCPAVKTQGMSACHGVRPLPDGSLEAVFGTYGKFLFKALKGTLEASCPWNEAKAGYDAVIFDILPDGSGHFELALHEDMVEIDCGSEAYPPFDALVKESLDSFEAFKKNYRPAAPGYEALRDYAAYTIWSHRAKAGGGFLEPAVLFQTSIAGLFSWHQAYHAMAMLGNIPEAWRMICTLFLYQDEKTGRLPGNIAYVGGANHGIQPPFQGFALDYLIRRVGDSFLTPDACARMYPKFAKWADYWHTFRDAGRGDDVLAINNPNDSGWDDASIFKDGFPAQNPDGMCFFILLTEMTARLARGCGRDAEADTWQKRSEKLLKTLIDEFWDGEKFVTKVNGKAVDSMSLACYQPIMLGDRLPQEIIDKIAARLVTEGDFLCEIGLCTESLHSPLCDYGPRTFVSGRVVAPPHLIFCVGLNLAGKKKEAALIARRWCDTVKERGIILGFPPYEYYKLTGEKAAIEHGPVASDGWCWSPWAAGCTMTLLTSIIAEE